MAHYDETRRRLVFLSGERISRRVLMQIAAAGIGGTALASVLAACGGDGDNEDESQAPEAEGAGATDAAAPEATSASEATSEEASPQQTIETSGEGEAKPGGTLRIGYEEPSSLDPQYITGVLEGNVVGLIYDALMTQDPYTADYIVGPCCESFEISEDQLTWTFHLKQGITFHDGTELTSQSVKECYDYALDPEHGAYVTDIYLPPDPTITVRDDYTVEISSPEPYGPMASHLFWDAWFGIISPAAREQYGQEDLGRNPVGSGPFRFTEWAVGDHLTLERYEDYTWGAVFLDHKGPAYLDELFFKFILEQSTIVSALQAGEIDMAFLPNQFYADFANNPDFDILTRPSGALTCLGWNHERWPYDDLKTRQALMYGFDRERFLEVMESGHGEIMYGTIVPALPHYWPGEKQEGQRYDPEKARQMLAEAGWEDTDGDGIIEKDGKPFRSVLVATGAEDYVRWASLVQAQAKELGIDVQIETLEAAAYSARLAEGDYDLWRFGYDTVDPDILAFFFYSPQIPGPDGSGFNRSRVNDPELDRLIEKQRTTLGEERDKAVEELVRYMMENATILPLYSPEKHTVVHKKVKGVIFYPNAMDWDLTQAWIDE